MHRTTFEYLMPTDGQKANMARVRTSFAAFASILDSELPAGPDKTYIMRLLRTIGMWANVTITRLPDGTPRPDPYPDFKLPDGTPRHAVPETPIGSGAGMKGPPPPEMFHQYGEAANPKYEADGLCPEPPASEK